MKNFLKEIFTDAKGRPEIKMILGVPCAFVGLIIGILMLLARIPKDWTGFSIFMGVATGLIVTNAITDAQIDKGEGE